MTRDGAIERSLDALLSGGPGGARVREWSIHAAESRRLSLGTKDRHTGGPHAPLGVAESLVARWLLVWDDGQVGASDLDRAALEGDLGEALERARAAARDDPDAAQVAGPATVPEVVLHDPLSARVAGGDTALVAARLESIRERFARNRFGTWSGAFDASESSARLVTSAGFDASARRTLHGWSATFDGEIGDGHVARAPEGDAEFAARLDRLAEVACLLREPSPPRPAALGRTILHPVVVRSLVLDTLLQNLEGAAVAHGSGRFGREAFGSGDPVVREDLTLRVEPLEPLRAGSYRFTREGVPAVRTTFIDRGRLATPVLGLKYARRLGLRPTGVPLAHDVLRLEGPAPVPLAEAIERAHGGTLVLRVLGMHTQDPTSGDFSLSSPQALAISGGRARGRVRVTIAGNVFEALRDETLELVAFPGEETPGLAIRCGVRDR